MEWLPGSRPEDDGKYALIHDGVLTVHKTEREANNVGFDRYGSINQFLVLKIERPKSTQQA
jgi:hypothetical protein